MKILLAGGAGYIGSSLIPVLLEHGYTTDVVDLMWFGNSIPDTINIRRQDIFDLKEVDVSGYDQVIFLAGLSNDPMAEFDPSKNFVSNGACPSYLAYICKRAGVRRFIYASSCSVYGYTVNELYDEESPVTCGYPYGVSKLQGERGVLQLADDDFSVAHRQDLERYLDKQEAILHLEREGGERLAGLRGGAGHGGSRGVEDTVVAGAEEPIVVRFPVHLASQMWAHTG